MADDKQGQSAGAETSVDDELNKLLAEVEQLSDDVTTDLEAPAEQGQAKTEPGKDDETINEQETSNPSLEQRKSSAPDAPCDPQPQQAPTEQAESDQIDQDEVQQEDIDTLLAETAALAEDVETAGSDDEHTETAEQDQRQGEPEPAAASDDQAAMNLGFQDDKIADDEIQEALERIENDGQPDDEQPEHVPAAVDPTAAAVPWPLKYFLSMLASVDHAFLWLPQTVKDCIGYVGISTLILGIILWVIIVFFH